MRSEAATLAPTKAAVTSLGRQEVLSNQVFMVDAIALRACTAHTAGHSYLVLHSLPPQLLKSQQHQHVDADCVTETLSMSNGIPGMQGGWAALSTD